MLEKVTRYLCKWCGNYFKTPNRHKCRKNPANRSCNTCNKLNLDDDGWYCEAAMELQAYTVFDCPEWVANPYHKNNKDSSRKG